MAKSNQAAPRNEKAAAARQAAQAQVRKEQRRTTALWILAGIVVVAIFAALVAFIVRQNSVSGIDSENQLTPSVATADGGLPVGQSGVVGEDLDPERVQLAIYFDYMCPICGTFEEVNGTDIQAMADEGLIDVIYHPIAILDHTSQGTNYSTRAGSVAALIAEEAPEQFVAFHVSMYNPAVQPEEFTRGLNDAELQDVARAVGVPEDVVAKIPAYSYANWVTTSTEKASIAGVGGTPTIMINGVIQDPRSNPDHVNWSEPGALRAAVEAAAAE